MADPCFVCKSESEVKSLMWANQVSRIVNCPRCGKYQTTDLVAAYLPGELDSLTKIAILSHSIRKMQKNKEQEFPPLDWEIIKQLLSNPLPKTNEQINNFILWLGENAPILGKKIDVLPSKIQAEVGTSSEDGIKEIMWHLNNKKIIELDFPSGGSSSYRAKLTIDGWENYENIKRGNFTSRRAFMAMKYGDKELDDLVTNHLRPAVKSTGFDLYRLDDVPRAGLIDDRLRVEIRNSRFLIADLTHENAGAYWEAGFAEGLGKPVIYTCEKNKFNEKKTHFDTNHHTTVLWDSNDTESTVRDLKNTIRATLPEDAKLNDGF